ncbi:hypothetical protein G195_011265, partial [Phytophthora kernoviae 00238/432]
ILFALYMNNLCVLRPPFKRRESASVYSFYPGVLPKVRCPVCLTLLNRNQWIKLVQSSATEQQEQTQEPEQEQDEDQIEQVGQVEQQFVDDNIHVLDKYVMLCQQSCGFQSPCCHKANYTMLPERSSDSDVDDNEDAKMELPLNQVEALPELRQRAVEYCYHRQDSADFYRFMTETFKENLDKVIWSLLPKIVDEERRATLLLRHLMKNPDTMTLCCRMQVCFKCKATDHHNGDCGDFIQANNVVECRGCGVTVVMVDGCDSLRCLCGYSFSWSSEVDRQNAQRKQIAPMENFEYDQWERWCGALRRSLRKIKNLDATQRELRLERFVRDHRPLLQRVLLPWVYRNRLSKKNAVDSIVEQVTKMKVAAETPLEPVLPMHAARSRSQSEP